jgi:hypothetical protein
MRYVLQLPEPTDPSPRAVPRAFAHVFMLLLLLHLHTGRVYVRFHVSVRYRERDRNVQAVLPLKKLEQIVPS